MLSGRPHARRALTVWTDAVRNRRAIMAGREVLSIPRAIMRVSHVVLVHLCLRERPKFMSPEAEAPD